VVPDFFEDTEKFLEEYGLSGAAVLPVDIYQTEDSVIVETPLPGIDPKNIEVSVDHNVLTIRGKVEHKTEIDEKNYYRKEVRSNSYHRAVALPVHVDQAKAEADYKNGMLIVRLPKASEPNTKTIQVKRSTA
jgi:HSP20 family protein